MGYTFSGENFQAWRNFTLPVEGLTVIVGSTNLGKSALIRALRAFLTNSASEAQITNGTNLMRLTLEMNDKNITAERKRKGSVIYKVEGENDAYAKLNGAVPSPVQALGFNSIKLGGEKLEPNFGTQFGGQFLVSNYDSTVHSFIGAFSATERLDEGMRKAKEDLSANTSQAKILSKQIQRAEERVARLDILDASLQRVEVEVHRLNGHIVHDTRLLTALDILIGSQGSLDTFKALLGQLPVLHIEPVSKLRDAARAYDQAAQYADRAKHLRHLLNNCSPLTIDPVRKLAGKAHAASQAIEAEFTWQRTHGLATRLPSLSTRALDSDLRKLGLITSLIDVERWKSTASAAHDAISELRSFWEQLRGVVKQRHAFLDTIAAVQAVEPLKAELKEADGHLSEARKQEKALRKEYEEALRTQTLCARCKNAVGTTN